MADTLARAREAAAARLVELGEAPTAVLPGP
jgi:hypothetical protein